MGWIRTNDGIPIDLQSTALTTQPPSLIFIIKNLLILFKRIELLKHRGMSPCRNHPNNKLK
jgi:hypothetical protein